MAVATTQGDEEVLTFRLGGQSYCVSIDNIDEIVDYDQNLTKLPETRPHVEGVIDLRGRTTTIVDPKALLDIADDSGANHVVVFDSNAEDDGQVGWIVDEVRKVVGIESADVDESVESRLARGIVRNGSDDFLVWLNPEAFE
ncbi:chemotaxis protein CheW [Halobacterium yunchengense]|uniref:chemotaxis protein CheW n=1 Tax=Halobacterium yunchengense TaxID=3108497 RepID=UPI003008228E